MPTKSSQPAIDITSAGDAGHRYEALIPVGRLEEKDSSGWFDLLVKACS